MPMEIGSRTRQATFNVILARRCKSSIKVVSITQNKIRELQKNSDQTFHTGRASIGRYLQLNFNQMPQATKIKNGPRTSNSQVKMQQTKSSFLPPLISSTLSNKTVRATGQLYNVPKRFHQGSLTLSSIISTRVRRIICAICKTAAS